MGFGLDGQTGLHRERAADWLIASPANAGSPQLPYCAPTAPSNRQRWPLAQRATPHPNLGLIATILRAQNHPRWQHSYHDHDDHESTRNTLLLPVDG